MCVIDAPILARGKNKTAIEEILYKLLTYGIPTIHDIGAWYSCSGEVERQGLVVINSKVSYRHIRALSDKTT